MKQIALGLILIWTVLLACPTARAAVNMTVNSGSGVYAVTNGVLQTTAIVPTGSASSSTSTTSTTGTATATASYTFTNPVVGSQAVIRLDFLGEHLESGDTQASTFGVITFTISEAVAYSISGSFQLSATGPVDVFFAGRLEALPTLVTLGQEVDYVEQLSSANLLLDGIKQGNYPNLFSSANLTGVLNPGTYRFLPEGSLYDTRSPENRTADGSGFAQLTLTQIQTVPEPATLTMFGLGALGFAGAALRRRKLAV